MMVIKKFNLLLVLFVFLGTFFISAEAKADTLPPVFSSQSPAPGSVIKTQNPQIRVRVNDPDGLKSSSLSVMIDDAPVLATFDYDYYEDRNYDVYPDYKNGTIYYNATGLADGPHNVTVIMSDNLNNTGVNYFTFTVAIPPQITGISPADGSSYEITPSIGATIYDNNLDPAQTKLTLDGTLVNHNFNSTTGALTYTPAAPLSEGTHRVNLQAFDNKGNSTTKDWTFYIDTSAPYTTQFSPLDGTVLNTVNANINLTVKDSGPLNKNTLLFKIDNTPFQASVKYGGHWEYDYDWEYWVETDPTTAIVEYAASNLPDGLHTISVSIADMNGHINETTWTFYVITPLKINSLQPVDKSITANLTPVISAVIPEDKLNVGSLIMKLDGQQVTHSFDAATRTVSYTPSAPLTQGLHNVLVSGADQFGNYTTKEWSFWVDTTTPTFSGMQPPNGYTLDFGYADIKITAKDTGPLNKNSVILKLDNNPMPASVIYDGHWEYDYDWMYWVETDPTTAIIEYKAWSLPDGLHTVSVSIADMTGHSVETSWSFYVITPLKITDLKPADKSGTTNLSPVISAVIPESKLNIPTLTMKLDGLLVNHIFDTTTKTISYTPPSPLTQGQHSVDVSGADQFGNYTTKSWTFYTDTLPPVFSDLIPSNGSQINKSTTGISLTAKDAVSPINKSSLIITVDNMPVNAYIKYGGYTAWDYDWEYWVETDPTTAYIEFNVAGLIDGIHYVNVTIADNAGNTSNVVWSFTVNEPPYISSLTPAPGSKITNLKPTITLKARDNEQVDPQNSVITVNGQAVAANFDSATGIFSYTTTENLPQEDYVTVNADISDKTGNRSTAQWQFYAYTYTQEMPIPADTYKCTNCHPNMPAAHPINNCASCHKTVIEDCWSCHTHQPYPAAYHDPTTTIANGSMHETHGGTTYIYCTDCHLNNNSSIPKHSDPFTIATQHKSPQLGCDQCHATTLTREHVMRKDSQGNTLTCETCHLNPPSAMADKVKLALANKDTRCEACHDNASGPHPSHDTGLDSNCLSCHGDTLFNEKQFHQTSDCSLCHGNSDKNIQAAIKTQDTRCNSCHSSLHGLNLAKSVPGDIPLYNVLSWTPPQSAQLWAGESWLPADYNSPEARLIISNRSNIINGIDVYNWYSSQLTAFGWTKSSGPNSGSNNFRVTFKKSERMLTLNFYGGQSQSADSPYIGYKIELLYK